MKSIPLTDEHRKKILKMIRKLFPETPHAMFFGGSDKDTFWISNYAQKEALKDKKPQIIEFFHWFEFSWRLLNQILKHRKSPIEVVEQIKLFGMVCFNHSSILHPIDWLYDHFKKLKL